MWRLFFKCDLAETDDFTKPRPHKLEACIQIPRLYRCRLQQLPKLFVAKALQQAKLIIIPNRYLAEDPKMFLECRAWDMDHIRPGGHWSNGKWALVNEFSSSYPTGTLF